MKESIGLLVSFHIPSQRNCSCTLALTPYQLLSITLRNISIFITTSPLRCCTLARLDIYNNKPSVYCDVLHSHFPRSPACITPIPGSCCVLHSRLLTCSHTYVHHVLRNRTSLHLHTLYFITTQHYSSCIHLTTPIIHHSTVVQP